MHAIWRGSISFGLVNIPINLYSGSEENRLNLRMLHKADLSPVRYAKVCRTEGKEITYQEIVKGFEYQKNEFIVLDEKDFEKADMRATHLIEIVEFVDEQEIDTRLYEKPYYLEPGKSAGKAYSLLSAALIKAKKVGVAKFVLHNREHIAILKPINDVLVLNEIRYVNELRDATDLNIPKNKLTRAEITAALALIKQLTGKFKIESYRDNYYEQLRAIIETKAKGKVPKAKGKKPVNTQAKNLMLALQQSLKELALRKLNVPEKLVLPKTGTLCL